MPAKKSIPQSKIVLAPAPAPPDEPEPEPEQTFPNFVRPPEKAKVVLAPDPQPSPKPAPEPAPEKAIEPSSEAVIAAADVKTSELSLAAEAKTSTEPKTFDMAKADQTIARLSLIDYMKEHFKKEKRVLVKVRNDADVPVQINGYTFIVRHGVEVEVPESVAKLLRDGDYI